MTLRTQILKARETLAAALQPELTREVLLSVPLIFQGPSSVFPQDVANEGNKMSSETSVPRRTKGRCTDSSREAETSLVSGHPNPVCEGFPSGQFIATSKRQPQSSCTTSSDPLVMILLPKYSCTQGEMC